MHFGTKNYLKNTYNHTAKHTLNYLRTVTKLICKERKEMNVPGAREGEADGDAEFRLLVSCFPDLLCAPSLVSGLLVLSPGAGKGETDGDAEFPVIFLFPFTCF
jgi:hypothetical protein